jgi:hypothetical protein
MEKKILTNDQIVRLREPLPAKALKQHPTKAFLTTINSIYVTERLNDVFGIGSWQTKSEIVESDQKMIVVKTTLNIPEYGISYECYGGNDNPDRGDAYKGAVTDAITKIGSWLGIGTEVWKNEAGKPQQTTQPKAQAQGQKKAQVAQPTTPPQPSAPTSCNSPAIEDDMDLVVALDEVKRAQSVDGLKEVWERWKPTYALNNRFVHEVNVRKKELSSNIEKI